MFWNFFGSTLTFLGPLPTVVQVSSAWGMGPGRGLSRPPMFPEQEHKKYLLRTRALQKLTTYHACTPAWRLWIIQRKEGKLLHSICSLFFSCTLGLLEEGGHLLTPYSAWCFFVVFFLLPELWGTGQWNLYITTTIWTLQTGHLKNSGLKTGLLIGNGCSIQDCFKQVPLYSK